MLDLSYVEFLFKNVDFYSVKLCCMLFLMDQVLLLLLLYLQKGFVVSHCLWH